MYQLYRRLNDSATKAHAIEIEYHRLTCSGR